MVSVGLWGAQLGAPAMVELTTYIALAKVYFAADRRPEGLETIERLLQRNPGQPQALDLRRRFQ